MVEIVPALRDPARQRADARGELLQGEGLGHVVVRTGIQPRNAVLHGIQRREEQNRRIVPVLPHPPHDVHAALPREHDVQNDYVVAGRLQKLPRVDRVEAGIHIVARRHEMSGDDAVHIPVIFHNQQSHNPSLP